MTDTIDRTEVERIPRLQLNAVFSIRTSKEMRREFDRVAKQIRMTPQDAGRLALWEFVKKYRESTERPDF